VTFGNSDWDFPNSIPGSDQQISSYPVGILLDRVPVGLQILCIEGIHYMVAIIQVTSSRGVATAMVEVGEEG